MSSSTSDVVVTDGEAGNQNAGKGKCREAKCADGVLVSDVKGVGPDLGAVHTVGSDKLP